MIQNIDQKTRKELVEIVKIQVEEFQNLHKEVERLEKENLKTLGWISLAMMRGLNNIDCSDELLKIIAIRDLEQHSRGIEDAIDAGIELDSIENDCDTCNAIRNKARKEQSSE